MHDVIVEAHVEETEIDYSWSCSLCGFEVGRLSSSSVVIHDIADHLVGYHNVIREYQNILIRRSEELGGLPGVWLVYNYSFGVKALSIHSYLGDAVRARVLSQEITWWPFGMTVEDAIKEFTGKEPGGGE